MHAQDFAGLVVSNPNLLAFERTRLAEIPTCYCTAEVLVAIPIRKYSGFVFVVATIGGQCVNVIHFEPLTLLGPRKGAGYYSLLMSTPNAASAAAR